MSQCQIVMYHYVRDTSTTPYPDIKALPTADFERQLDGLQASFEVLTYPQFEQMLKGEIHFDRPTALLTFDDGFIDNYEVVYPIFQRRGISGVFFITSSTQDSKPTLLNVHKTHFLLAKMGATPFANAVESEFARSLYVSRAQISEMAAGGMTFGGHTRTHRVLSRLSDDEQYDELADGFTLIRELTGQDSIPFCYPYGHPQTYNQATLEHLSKLGYSTAFNTVRRPLETADFERYALPRFDTRDLPPFVETTA